MTSNNFYRSDLTGIYNIVQSSMLVYPKEQIIETLRNFFGRDSYYHYSKDMFGFANTTDHTNLPLGADLPSGPGAQPQLSSNPILPTRLFIGENYRYDSIYYPAILVKSGGSTYVPISINREQGTIYYSELIIEDGYGNQALVRKPSSFVTAGAWEGSIIIDVYTRSLRSRDDLVELIGMCFTDIHFDTLHEIGIIVKPPVISAPSEQNDRNDKLFLQSITLNIRTEWRREVKIGSLIDSILFTIDFANPNTGIVAPNLTINTNVSLTDMLLNTPIT